MKRSLILALVLSLLLPWPAFTACTNTINLSLCKPGLGDTNWGTNLNSNFDILDNPPKLVVSGAGPHAIGGATDARIQLYMRGAFTASGGAGVGLFLSTAISPPAGQDAYGIQIIPTLVEAGSGTHPMFASLTVNPPAVTGGAADLTAAAALYIVDPPSGATSNYTAILGGDGALTRVDGHLLFTRTPGNEIASNYSMLFAIDADANAADTEVFQWYKNRMPGGGAGSELMRLTESGILALGTPTTTGAAAGQIVLLETTAPTAAAANHATIFVEDNGSGKTRVCAQFASGSAQCFATQP